MKLASNGGPQAVSRPIGAFTSIGQEEAQAASDVVLSGSLSGFFGSPHHIEGSGRVDLMCNEGVVDGTRD